MNPLEDDPMEDNEEYTDDHMNSQATKKRKTRGRTCMTNLVDLRSGGGRIEVLYNKDGSPEGKAASNLSSFLGVIARTNVPIIYKSWPAVPLSLKNNIWDMVQKAFIVDKRSRKQVLAIAGKAWRTFKSSLTTTYVKEFKDQPDLLKQRPVDYDFIPQSHWDVFVKSRLADEFVKISETASKRRACHQYDHRMSRKGYAKLEAELKLASGEDTNIDRSILWKKARVDKQGNYLNAAVKQRADRIDAITKDVEDGVISTSGSNDILTMALETPEYPGRVRGVGCHIKPNMYFNTPRCRSQSTQKALLQKMEQMQNQLYMFTSLLQPDQLSKMQQLFPGRHGPEKASCVIEKDKGETCSNEVASMREIKKPKKTPKGKEIVSINICKVKQPPKEKEIDLKLDINKKTSNVEAFMEKSQDIEKLKRCKLAVGTIDNIVAIGMLIPLDGLLHGAELGNAYVRIAVEVAIKEDALLPKAIDDEIVTVKQAIGTHVAWPRHLVIMINEKFPVKPPKSSAMFIQEPYKMPLTMRLLLRLAKTMHKNQTAMVQIESAVFGNEQTAYLGKDDITQFCLMEPISTVCISIYMSYLWSMLKKKNQEHLYKFVDPSCFSHDCGKRDKRLCALTRRLEDTQEKQLVIAPYNSGNHWMMAVINPCKNIAYYLDSLNPMNINEEMKGVVDLALKMFNAGKKGRNGRKKAVWKIVQCPIQVGSMECGFYIMKFMKAIIEEPSLLMENKFHKQTYTQEEIDDVRVEWAELVDSFLQDDA